MTSARWPSGDGRDFLKAIQTLAAILFFVCLFPSWARAQQRTVIKVADTIFAIALSPTGKYFAGGGSGDKHPVYVWETTTGKLESTFKGLPNVATMLHWSADEKNLTSFCTNLSDVRDNETRGTSVKRWNLANKMEIESFFLTQGGANRAVCADGRYLVTVRGPTRTLLVWDLERKAKWATLIVDSRQAASAAVHKSGELAATGGSSGDIILWQLPAEKVITKIKAAPAEDFDPAITFLDISPDRSVIASIHRNRNCQMWSVKDGKPLGKAFGTATEQCRFTPDGKFLLTGGKNSIDIRSVATQEIVAKLESDTPELRVGRQLVISADGKTAAATGTGGIHIWSIPDLKE